MATPGRVPILFDANSEATTACMHVVHRAEECG